MPPSRKIASNLLWTPQGIVRNPLVRVSEEGRIMRVEECPDPDREPLTEFHAGLLVADFDTDYHAAFARLCSTPNRSLAESLPEAVTHKKGILVVISGIDYDTLCPTPHARIERL